MLESRCPVLICTCLLVSGTAGVRAQETPYPSRGVQIVVPYTPGATADILARSLGPKLAERWKVPVVTDNRPGATGAIGMAYAAKAAPDGHTLLFVASSYTMIAAVYPNLAFDAIKSFLPVIQITTSPLALAVHPQLPVRSVRELVRLAQQRPGAMLYASPGNGSAQHLAMELFKLETATNIVHVPHRGLSGALSDLIGGHVQVMIATVQTLQPHAASARLRMLSATGPIRSPAFPEIPTLKEQGFDLEIETWSGALVPAGTPQSTISRLNGEINTLLESTDVRDLVVKQGMVPVGGPRERLSMLIEREVPRWARVVRTAKIKLD